MFRKLLTPQKGASVSCQILRKGTQIHCILLDVLTELLAPLSMLQSVVTQQDRDDPSHKPYWYGSLICLDSAFILPDYSDSIFAVFSFLLLKTKIISKPMQGHISSSETVSLSWYPAWGRVTLLDKTGTQGTTPDGKWEIWGYHSFILFETFKSSKSGNFFLQRLCACMYIFFSGYT